MTTEKRPSAPISAGNATPLPADFIALMHQHWPQEADNLCRALQETDASVSVRINRAKSPEGLPKGCEEGAKAVPWCKDAYYLPTRPSFTFDPALHGGAYYVQEASSMFLAQAIGQHVPDKPLVALDLCAAPGGKSTLLRALLHPESLLVSNEPMRQRAQVLAENMTKWGDARCVVTQNYPADFSHLQHTFDLVVADVPCSGEGMFRKDDEAIRDWSLQNVDTCWRRQRSIIQDIWPALKPGGLLVYSTCTFNRLEDEDNVDWICHTLGAERLSIAHDTAWGIHGEYHFFPGRTEGEGFFLALLRKSEDEELSPLSLHEGKAGKQKRQKPAKDEGPAEAKGWIKDAERFSFLQAEDNYLAIPADYQSLIARLRQDLHVLLSGITLAERKGRDWVPCHALAMSTSLQSSVFPRVELTYEQAIAYLRREAIFVEAPKGFVIVCYEGLPLGFVKNLGTRANNLYPAEWRIRKQGQ